MQKSWNRLLQCFIWHRTPHNRILLRVHGLLGPAFGLGCLGHPAAQAGPTSQCKTLVRCRLDWTPGVEPQRKHGICITQLTRRPFPSAMSTSSCIATWRCTTLDPLCVRSLDRSYLHVSNVKVDGQHLLDRTTSLLRMCERLQSQMT